MSKTGLVVIDMLSPYDFDDAELVAESAESAIGPIGSLLESALENDVEVIYVNDNYSDWNSSEEKLIENAMRGKRPELVEPILPPEDASFVLKPRHTIFYQTPLDYLLYQREIGHLVLVGQVTEQCILYSALDAYVRHYEVSVPPDAVAHIHEPLGDAALKMMERNMHANLVESADCTFAGS